MADFSKAKVGDRVWDFVYGWGEIEEVGYCGDYPLWVTLPGENGGSFTLDGRRDLTGSPTLFHGPIKYEEPPAPKRKVKKVLDCWVNVYEDGVMVADTKEDLDKFYTRGGLEACIHVVQEYEVEV